MSEESEAYQKAVVQAREAREKAIARAWEVYSKAVDQARESRDKATPKP